MLYDEEKREKSLIFLISLGAILFYLPFLSYQFIGDDWLWLANAKKALTDPSIFIERPMYGYFRPLNMVVVSIMEFVFGPNARVFSFLNILLHAINVFLLWMVLKKYDAPKDIRVLAPFIFAFYYLNCAAIEWISVGHDLWVTGLMLIFLVKLKTFIDQTNPKDFIIMFMIGWAAALFKESGLVAIGFYFAYFILESINPFSKKYFAFSMIYVVSYLTFLIFYFLTRTVADKQIELGIPIIINIWYFLVYLLIPLAKRVVDGLSGNSIIAIVIIRNALTFIIPLLLGYVYFKGSRIIRLFVIWPIFFLGTIAVFKWGVSLFTLYPNDPASRFMYTPFVGMAVVIAYLIVWVCNRILKLKINTIAAATIIMIFIAINFALVFIVSPIYFKQQALSQSVIDNIRMNWDTFRDVDSITILTDDLSKTEQIIASGEHLPAIILVIFGKPIGVKIYDLNTNVPNINVTDRRNVILRWDIIKNHLAIDIDVKSP